MTSPVDHMEALIDVTTRCALQAYLPHVLATAGRGAEGPLRGRLWGDYASGLSEQELALLHRCPPSRVRQLLKIETHAHAIAAAVAEVLKLHPAFRAAAGSQPLTQGMIEVLRDYILSDTDDDETITLRRWLRQHHLPASSHSPLRGVQSPESCQAAQ